MQYLQNAEISPGLELIQKLKSLATEDYKDMEDWLFGPGFLEKAAKKLETEKALAMVIALPSEQQKRPFQEDKKDLCSFISKGAPSKYGYKGTQRQNKPYNSSSTFKQGQYKQSQYRKKQPRSQENYVEYPLFYRANVQ